MRIVFKSASSANILRGWRRLVLSLRWRRAVAPVGLFLAFLLSACGGGGDGATEGQKKPPQQIVVNDDLKKSPQQPDAKTGLKEPPQQPDPDVDLDGAQDPPQMPAFDADVDCAGQWPCREQFAEALSAAIEGGDATLNHERAMVLDQSPGHGNIVASTFRIYGSGASVRLTVIDRFRGGSSAVTSVVFAKLPAKKKLIIAHSISNLIASAETMREKEAIVAQSTGNIGKDDPTYYYNSSGYFPDDVVQGSIRAEKLLDTGLMAIVGGIAKVSEVPAAGVAHSAYCATGKPHITLEGVDYCSVFNRCGWTANYCLVAPAENVIYDAETGARDGGTSLAAPQAAAALQILATMWPKLSQVDLVALLLELADDIGEPDIDPVYGHGRLSFRRLYRPDGLPLMTDDGLFRFSCDAIDPSCKKEPM